MQGHRKTKIEVIIEKNGDELWGRIEDKGDYLPVTVGSDIDEVLNNLKDIIADYLEHEGKADKFWSTVNVADIKFAISWDLSH